MPRRITMGDLVDRCQQLADLENDDSVTDVMWKSFISMVYGEAWSEVANGAGRYFETSTTITADGSASYDEPEGHYATIRVVRVDGDFEYPLRELRQQQESSRKGTTGDAVEFTLVDDQLYLYPVPSDGTYKWYYLQQATDLSAYADDDIVDLICPAGEHFIIWGAITLALARQQKSVQLSMAERERARVDLQVWAAQRNFHEPKQRLAEEDEYYERRLSGDWEPWR